MILTHHSKTPQIHPSAYIAPNATVCGDVIIGPGCRIMFGACIVAEGKSLELGKNCIVMENAVFVYGVERGREGESNMPEVTKRRSEALRSHQDDIIVI